jgi:hypothetical protein
MVGDVTLAQTRALPGDATRPECVHRLDFASGKWSLHDGLTGRASAGTVDQMPVVNGLFSGVDLRSPSHPQVAVTTQTHKTVTSTRQSVAWIAAVACGLFALILVGFQRRPRLRPAWTATARSVAAAHPIDAAIAVLLLGWWIGAPAFFDDGWTIARQTAFRTTGGFSNYYESFGANLPLGYWLEWSQHWLTQTTNALVILRIPALVCLAATWVLCRWILAQLTSRSPGPMALCALAVGFAAMAMAWGMTLRQEPAVALLVAGVMACCVRFLKRQTAGPLAIAAVLIPLALSAHPAGIVALAPLIALLPLPLRWARSHPAAAVALVTASGAIALALAFLGSDVEQRARDAQTMNDVSTTIVDWRDELNRYTLLTQTDVSGVSGYGAPLRRGSVALMLLAALAFVGRRRRGSRTPLDLPAMTLIAALVLLVATPSKWPWHFSALIAFVAVAVATEALRLRGEAARSTDWKARPLIAIGVTTVAIAWSWFPRGAWNALDLRTLDWTLGLESWLPFSKLALALPLALLAAGVASAARRGSHAYEVPWRVAAWSAPILVVPLMAFTVSVLVVDAARTASWTLPRQNLDALHGEGACGVADELLVPSYASMRPLPLRNSATVEPTPAWLPAPPVPRLPRFILGPVSRQSSASPWFVVAPDQPLGLFVSGQPAAADRLELEWGAVTGRRVRRVRLDAVPLRSVSERGATVPWRFVAAGELQRPPRDATVTRLVLSSDEPSATTIGVTSPVKYTNETLASRLDRRGASELVLPNMLAFTPCARLPRLADGIVEVPATLVTTRDWPTPFPYVPSSPFAGLFDLYPLERLTLTDSPNPPSDVVVFGVNQHIYGAREAKADKRISA